MKTVVFISRTLLNFPHTFQEIPSKLIGEGGTAQTDFMEYANIKYIL